MGKGRASDDRPPKGVSELDRPRGGRRFRASIRHKGNEVHLGLYETRWLAAFAFNVASQAIGRGAKPPNEIPDRDQPSTDRVREIVERVRARLGLGRPPRRAPVAPADPEALAILFAVAVVGFWRNQAETEAGGRPGEGLDASAGRIEEAAGLLFRDPQGPSPEQAMGDLLARRLDAVFRRGDLTRAVMDDDGDDPWRVARWLAHPDLLHSARGFAEEVRHRYAEFFEGEAIAPGGWAAILGLSPPFSAERVREAYRAKSRMAHPDAGGSPAEFVRLNAAYEEARAFLRGRGEKPSE